MVPGAREGRAGGLSSGDSGWLCLANPRPAALRISANRGSWLGYGAELGEPLPDREAPGRQAPEGRKASDASGGSRCEPSS